MSPIEKQTTLIDALDYARQLKKAGYIALGRSLYQEIEVKVGEDQVFIDISPFARQVRIIRSIPEANEGLGPQ